MLLSHIIAALPLAVAALPTLPRRTPLLVHLADNDNCRINLGSRQYDLLPLLGGTEVRSLTTTDDREATYVFRFGADADPDPESSSGHHCFPSGTGVYVFHGRPSDSDPIIYDTSSTVVSVDPAESSEFLTLQFSGTEGITARLRLVCDSRAHLPTYTGPTTGGGVPLFTWRTQHGCALPLDNADALLRVHSTATEESGSEGETPPPNEKETPEQGDNNSEDRLMDDGRQRASRRSTAVILFFISFAIISLSILSYKHPHRINLFLSTYVKPLLPARLSLETLPRISLPHSLSLKPAGEGRLMRWAHEDLELDESEDFMVNGLGVDPDDLGGTGEDEQIPLRPSMRKGGGVGVKTYGSAPPSPFW